MRTPMKLMMRKTSRCIYQYFLRCALILSFFEGRAGFVGTCVRTSSSVSASQEPMSTAK